MLLKKAKTEQKGDLKHEEVVKEIVAQLLRKGKEGGRKIIKEKKKK